MYTCNVRRCCVLALHYIMHLRSETSPLNSEVDMWCVQGPSYSQDQAGQYNIMIPMLGYSQPVSADGGLCLCL